MGLLLEVYASLVVWQFVEHCLWQEKHLGGVQVWQVEMGLETGLFRRVWLNRCRLIV